MSSTPPPPAQSSLFIWGLGLAATSLILIGGGALIMSAKSVPDTAPPPDGFGEGVQIPSKRTRAIDLPLPPPDVIVPAFHTVNFTTENGVRVVKIRVVPEGDELIVDAATGRLLESRPSRPTAPPPMGKFAAPLFEPMT